MKQEEKQKVKLIKLVVPLIIIVVALLFGIITKDDIYAAVEKGFSEKTNKTSSKTNETATTGKISKTYFEVLKVVDGDTIQIDYNGTKERVRLIGVDTPESVHPDENKNTENGKKASEYTKNLLTGKKVQLELDVQERDKYGRILAYVYLDGKMVNKKLLEDGYAQVATYPPNIKYVKEFLKIQEKAKEQNKGLWGEE
ncbi:MAG: thermonuclease family protein [Clostridia bacterium]|nr:thermonuclease family protein [Clostridia bacterium]